MNVVDVRLGMSERDFLKAEMLGGHIDKPVAGTVVAGWRFDDGVHLKVRPDVAVEKAVPVYDPLGDAAGMALRRALHGPDAPASPKAVTKAANEQPGYEMFKQLSGRRQ